MVSYSYDAWGKPISKTGTLASTLGTIQPFRYRGDVFDEETGLYYLSARYYSQERCRFVNSDWSLGEKNGIISKNCFCYCVNNPICRIDATGTWSKWNILGYIGTAIEAVASVIKDGAAGLAAWAVETSIWGATTWAVASLWGVISASLTSVLASVCVFAWVAIPIVVAGALAAVCIKKAIFAESTSPADIRDDMLALAYDELVNNGHEYFWCQVTDKKTGETINTVFTFINDTITVVTDEDLIAAITNADNDQQQTAQPNQSVKKAVRKPSLSPGNRFAPVCMLN